MDNKFIIPINGLAAGENRFSWQAGKEFFEGYDNTEVIDAQLDIDINIATVTNSFLTNLS